MLLLCAPTFLLAQTPPAPCPPLPTEEQLRWQEMEMYAFLHYSLNTYTDQEWGYGNEALQLFNPTQLDVRQWVGVCRQAGMRGIILTAKHHCGFCLWPSKYTEYSVKNVPWKDGRGDIVRELADACRELGLKFAVYLSPWDRNHADYGRPEYITYFRNQLHELLTDYGEIFEVWFDGANGGNGWYGGADETRHIDRRTYYEWDETYRMIRSLQPHCLIWNDGGKRGDLRWVGNEAGSVGDTNWSLLPQQGDVSGGDLRFGREDGDAWVAAETNTSIRPGWFYHVSEDENVKSLQKLMDTYYKSVGRNSCLLLNFPIAPNGRIHPVDSLRALEFAQMIDSVFKNDLARKAQVEATNVRGDSHLYAAHNVTDGRSATYWATDDSVTQAALILTFPQPATFNRFLIEEYIPLGQRVKQFSLEALVDGQWMPLRDALAENGDGLTTIGNRRIICFSTITATRLRLTILQAKACPLIRRIGTYLAPEISRQTIIAPQQRSSDYYIFFADSSTMMINLKKAQTVTGFRYLPPQTSRNGTVKRYSLWATMDWNRWEKLSEGEFSNVVNNPVWQTVKCTPTKARVIRLQAEELAEGGHIGYADVEILSE